jgi:hypothetical protein
MDIDEIFSYSKAGEDGTLIERKCAIVFSTGISGDGSSFRSLVVGALRKLAKKMDKGKAFDGPLEKHRFTVERGRTFNQRHHDEYTGEQDIEVLIVSLDGAWEDDGDEISLESLDQDILATMTPEEVSAISS